jgi:hypothetical protein
MAVDAMKARTYTQEEIDAHRYEMREAFDGGLISFVEYQGQLQLMEEAEEHNRRDEANLD